MKQNTIVMREGLEDLLRFFIRHYITNDSTVLDVGASCTSLAILSEKTAKLHSISYTKNGHAETILGNFLSYNFQQTFDAVWCSHVLEHAPNVGIFIKKLVSVTSPEGHIGIVVPTVCAKALIGGHLNDFTPGKLAYNVVINGQDISEATVLKHYNNIALMWKRSDMVVPPIKYDRGDLETLSKWFPIRVEQGTPEDERWHRIRKRDFDFRLEKYTTIQKEVCRDIGKIDDRYTNTELLWNRHKLILLDAEQKGFKVGLDFGPGTCPSLIMGDLLNMQISGLDIKEHYRTNRLIAAQQKAKTLGYDIIWHQTSKYPWPLSDNQFEFIICSDSIFVDWELGHDWKECISGPNCIQKETISRILEIIRILKPNGCLYVRGGSCWGKDIDKLQELQIISEKKIRLLGSNDTKITDYGLFPNNRTTM